MVGGVLALVAVAMLSVVRRSSLNEADEAEAQPPAQVAASEAAIGALTVVESAPVPTWGGPQHATWAPDGSKTIAFELQAINDVSVWMTRVRPTLVVRCVSRMIDVFVVMKTSASVEPRADSHTIHLRIDDNPEELQQWSGSQSQQELFAPDGPRMIRRLARAHRMQFGFRPYNSPPVTAEFAVQGFDRLAGLVAGTCGWRLDDAVPSGDRRNSLKTP
jgi:hypothetical protein